MPVALDAELQASCLKVSIKHQQMHPAGGSCNRWAQLGYLNSRGKKTARPVCMSHVYHGVRLPSHPPACHVI